MTDICGRTHNIITLSLFSGCASILLCVLTVPLTSAIICALVRNADGKFNGTFYKLLLNIAVTDFLTGVAVDAAAISFHFREARGVATKSDSYAVHISMFLTDGIALMTMTFLSIDRLVALLKPYAYRAGISKTTENSIVLLAWILGTLIVIPYFYVGYIKELLFFTVTNVLIASLALLVTTIVYRVNFKDRAIKSAEMTSDDRTESGCSSSEPSERLRIRNVLYQPTLAHLSQTGSVQSITVDRVRGMNDLEQKMVTFVSHLHAKDPNTSSPMKPHAKKLRSFAQKRVTRAFKSMLVVFISSYLPTGVMMIYLNLCLTCNCVVVHIMRDVCVLSILSSSLFRSLNFIWTLKHLKKSIKQMLN